MYWYLAGHRSLIGNQLTFYAGADVLSYSSRLASSTIGDRVRTFWPGLDQETFLPVQRSAIADWVDKVFTQYCGLSNESELEVRDYRAPVHPNSAATGEGIDGLLSEDQSSDESTAGAGAPSGALVSKPWLIAFLALTALVTLWSFIQIVHLSIALFGSAPSPSAELLFSHRQPYYVAWLGVHSFIAFWGVVFLFVPLDPDFRAKEFSPDDNPAGLFMAVAMFGVLPLLIVLGVSTAQPRHQVFVSLPEETIIQEDTRLLPLGVNQRTLDFAQIEVIVGRCVGDEYSLTVRSRGGSEVELKQVDRTGFRGPPNGILAMAQDLSEKSGARLDLSECLGGA